MDISNADLIIADIYFKVGKVQGAVEYIIADMEGTTIADMEHLLDRIADMNADISTLSSIVIEYYNSLTGVDTPGVSLEEGGQSPVRNELTETDNAQQRRLIRRNAQLLKLRRK